MLTRPSFSLFRLSASRLTPGAFASTPSAVARNQVRNSNSETQSLVSRVREAHRQGVLGFDDQVWAKLRMDIASSVGSLSPTQTAKVLSYVTQSDRRDAELFKALSNSVYDYLLENGEEPAIDALSARLIILSSGRAHVCHPPLIRALCVAVLNDLESLSLPFLVDVLHALSVRLKFSCAETEQEGGEMKELFKTSIEAIKQNSEGLSVSSASRLAQACAFGNVFSSEMFTILNEKVKEGAASMTYADAVGFLQALSHLASSTSLPASSLLQACAGEALVEKCLKRVTGHLPTSDMIRVLVALTRLEVYHHRYLNSQLLPLLTLRISGKHELSLREAGHIASSLAKLPSASAVSAHLLEECLTHCTTAKKERGKTDEPRGLLQEKRSLLSLPPTVLSRTLSADPQGAVLLASSLQRLGREDILLWRSLKEAAGFPEFLDKLPKGLLLRLSQLAEVHKDEGLIEIIDAHCEERGQPL